MQAQLFGAISETAFHGTVKIEIDELNSQIGKIRRFKRTSPKAHGFRAGVVSVDNKILQFLDGGVAGIDQLVLPTARAALMAQARAKA